MMKRRALLALKSSQKNDDPYEDCKVNTFEKVFKFNITLGSIKRMASHFIKRDKNAKRLYSKTSSNGPKQAPETR